MALDSPRNANGMHHNHKYHSFCLRSDTMLRQCNGTAISQLSNMHMPEVLQWNTSQDLWHIRPDTEARKRSGFDLFAARLGPQGVERARLVHALVGVGAEVVALALDEGGRQTLGTQAVEVGQRRGERRGQIGRASCRERVCQYV